MNDGSKPADEMTGGQQLALVGFAVLIAGAFLPFYKMAAYGESESLSVVDLFGSEGFDEPFYLILLIAVEALGAFFAFSRKGPLALLFAGLATGFVCGILLYTHLSLAVSGSFMGDVSSSLNFGGYLMLLGGLVACFGALQGVKQKEG